jgi:hypothetical protein
MKLNKPANFDGVVFLAALANAGFSVAEVIDNGEGSLLINLDDKHLSVVEGLLN